ncbi:MAG: nuclear transport factor 2 family protein [Vicingaceae bacterium]
MKSLYIIVALSLSFICNAQIPENESPEAAIKDYFDGYTRGDTVLLKHVFHPTFHLSWISPWTKGKNAFQQVDREEMFSFFGPNWQRNKINCSILETKIHDKMALVKARVEIEGVVVWIDYINLLQIDGRWWIVSKTSVGEI